MKEKLKCDSCGGNLIKDAEWEKLQLSNIKSQNALSQNLKKGKENKQ